MYIKHLLNATIFMLEGDKTIIKIKNKIGMLQGFFKRVTVFTKTNKGMLAKLLA